SRVRRASSGVTMRRRGTRCALQNQGVHGRAPTAFHMPRPASILSIRRQIDHIDDQLLRLLNQRAELALTAGAQKERRRAAIYAPGREHRVLARLTKQNGGPLAVAHVRAIFREIISASRGLEQRLRVAYFGPQASWTHLAARRHFGEAAEYVSSPTVGDVFRDVEGGRAELGVVPVENSSEGMVARTLDLLVESPLSICAEVALPVRHCLLVRPGTERSAVRRVA